MSQQFAMTVSFSCYCGMLGRLFPVVAFSLSGFCTIFTNSVNTDFHLLNTPRVGLPQRICVDGYAFRA